MPITLPEPHRNRNTKLTEPVFIFTDEAIVPPPKANGAPPAATQEKTPADLPPDEPKPSE